MCDKCDWDDYLEIANELMEDSDYDFAIETVEGIQQWIESNEHVTEKQKRALINIQESKHGSD